MGQKAWLHNDTGKTIADMRITDDEIEIMWMDGTEARYKRRW